jgi:hypothetical protein
MTTTTSSSTPALPAPDPDQTQWVRSHLQLRRFIGCVGFFLPIAVVMFNWAWGEVVDLFGGVPAPSFWGSIQGSISGYYYTASGLIFVSCMVTFGVFLITYKYGRRENLVGNIGGTAAVLVGLCPTSPRGATTLQTVVGGLHLVAAATFFVCMAIFCLWLFPKDPNCPEVPVPARRQQFFRVAGSIIVACIVVAVLGLMLLPDEVKNASRYLLWPESIAVFAFAASWMLKGRPLATA